MNSIKFTSKLADGSFNSKNVVSHKPPVVIYESVMLVAAAVAAAICAVPVPIPGCNGYRRVVIASGNFFDDDCVDGTAQSLSFSISWFV